MCERRRDQRVWRAMEEWDRNISEHHSFVPFPNPLAPFVTFNNAFVLPYGGMAATLALSVEVPVPAQ